MRMLKSKLVEIKEREHLDKIEDIKGDQKEIGWGSQIRSYVFMPYTLVKDHRTGYEAGNINAVMDGDLDGFIQCIFENGVAGKAREEELTNAGMRRRNGMRNRKQPSWLQTASKGKKRVLAAVCILLVLGVLSPFVINGIVVGSARRYILEPQETEQVNADCVIALGAMVWGKDTLSHMLEDRVLGAIDVYERGGAKKILMSGDHGQEDYDESQ